MLFLLPQPPNQESVRHKRGTMDYISEAERLKLYYKGLKKAGDRQQIEADYPLFVSWVADPDYDTTFRDELAFLLDYFYPLYKKLAYAVNNRLIHEELPYLEPQQQLSCTAHEIYHSLMAMEPYSAEEVIRTIGCSSATMTLLTQTFSDHDEEAFAAIINDNACDLSLVSNVCEYIWPNHQYLSEPSEEDTVAGLDAVASLLRDVAHPVGTSAQRLSEAIEPFLEGGDWDSYLQTCVHYDRDAFDFLCAYYNDNYDLFKPKERQQIEPLIQQGGGTVTAPFHLPDDYFDFRHETHESKEFFGLHSEVVKGGSHTFGQLVEFLAEEGYIGSSPAVKHLFAYRFSGKMRPTKVESIEWHGRNGNSYELIYLVKHLTERGDYRKMRQFFTGPRWVKDHDSSYARGANYRLKEFLHKLYPTLSDQL